MRTITITDAGAYIKVSETNANNGNVKTFTFSKSNLELEFNKTAETLKISEGLKSFDVPFSVFSSTPAYATFDLFTVAINAMVSTPASSSSVNLGTPVNSVAARGTLTLIAGTGSTILNNKVVTVGGKTYTFKTTLGTTEGNVLIGATDTTALANLLAAINHTGTPNTDYYCAAVNPLVTGISSNATTLIVEYKTKGIVGNSSACTTNIAGAWDETTLGTTVAGVDGTIGYLTTIYQDVDNVYFTLGNTISDANWYMVEKVVII